MHIEGKVTSKTENASGHSQVRISAQAVAGKPGQEATKGHEVELILSTPSAEVVALFKIGQTVSCDL